MLTSNHISLVNIALDSGQYEAALPVLEKPYVFLPMADQAVSNLGAKNASPWAYILPRAYLTGIITRDNIMRYDEACGLIFGRLRRWKDAHAAFGRIVAFPSRDASVTVMMAESYKKWVLTGLLALGHAPKMPSYAHPG
jgi:COP9 signalosome complex subunit 3